ncbi:TetR/AcrR family transcriptional regulator [Nocardioides houyundeii]|uniref:TetR/AcrR family transcriptional regulator n=1 Tax=Nocardioides houyundeii TaxID=2045452 RepID=UPI000DF1C964|nr:TetR/AcrR family transcriptional regulator [Nocardioides houyundeii]
MAKRAVRPSDEGDKGDGARTPRRFDRYEMVIASAAEIFRSNGYDATSLQQIADDVGILKGSLYHYIDTKEDLLFAIIKRNHEHITQENSQWRDLVGDPVAAIRSFIEGHMRESLWNPTFSEVFVRDFRALSPERAKIIRETQDAYDAEFRGLIAAAIETGALRDGVEPAFAARAVFGMTNWVYYWYHPGGSLSVDDVVTKMSDYAMASLMEPANKDALSS